MMEQYSADQVFSLKLKEQNKAFNPQDNIILLTFDDNYLAQAINLILSVARHNPEGVSFICVCPPLKQSSISELLSIKQGIQLRCYDFSFKFETGRWSVCTFLRLYAAWLLDEEIKRVLYMDADMLCSGSLQELFNMDVHCVAMCNEISGNVSSTQQRVFRPVVPTQIYCNAGVSLFNLDYLREHHSFDEIYQAYNNMHDKIAYLDQDFLNIYFHEKIQVLNAFHYNFQPNELWGTPYYKAALKNCRLLHFAVGKPWIYKTRFFLIRLYLKHSEYEPIIRRVRKTYFLSALYWPIRFARHMLSPLKQAYLERKNS